MKIRSELYNFFKIGIIDAIVLLACFLSNYTGILKPVLYTIIIGTFFAYLFTVKDEMEICNYEIIMCIFSTFFLDSTFHYLRLNTPLELNYICECMSIILCFKIMFKRKKYSKLLKDPFLKVILVSIVVSIITSLINLNSFIDLINGLRIYFRFIPIYIVLSHNKVDYKMEYKIFYFVNLVIFTILSVLGVFKDLRTGIFGIVGGATFEMFMSIALMYMLVKYLSKEVSFIYLALTLCITIVCYAVNESKAYIFITVLLTLIVAVIVNTKIMKNVITFFIIGAIFVAGMDLLVKLYPKFIYVINYKQFASYVTEFIFGNSDQVQYKMGRFQGMVYVADNEQKDDFEKIFGVGIGKSIPLENWFYVKDKERYQEVFDFPISPIYSKYGETLGYHLSSFSLVFIDGGYFATVICILIITIFAYKGIYLLRNGINVNEMFIGATAFFMAISAIYSCGYSGALRNRGYQVIVLICIGIAEKTYKDVKSRKDAITNIKSDIKDNKKRLKLANVDLKTN